MIGEEEQIHDLFEEVFQHYLDAVKFLDDDNGLKAEILESKVGYAPSVDTHGWEFIANKIPRDKMDLAIKLGIVMSPDKHRQYDRFRDRLIFAPRKNGKIVTMHGVAPCFGRVNPVVFLHLPDNILHQKNSTVELEAYDYVKNLVSEKMCVDVHS